MRSPRVVVDRELCVGASLCRLVAPEFFLDAGDGTTAVSRNAEIDEDDLDEAIEGCPVGAIYVVSTPE